MNTVPYYNEKCNGEAPRLSYHFAPNITHDSIAKMSPAQKEQALHELIDMRDITREKIFTPTASPQTRILALAMIYDRAHKTATRRPDGSRVLESVTQQVPTWIGDADKEGSLVYRLGISRNAITNEMKAFEKAGLLSKFYRDSPDSFNQHLDVAITPELLTHSELLPGKGERPRRPPVTCRECGSTDLRRKTTIVCADCGTVHSESDTFVNQEEEQEYTEETQENPNTPPDVGEDVYEQTQQPLCTREVHSVIDMNNCTREVHSVLADWLQKRVGQGQVIFATGRPNYTDKYLSFVGPLHIDSYLAGDVANIYGSQLRQADGSTWLWSADIDTRDAEIYNRIDEFLQRLKSAGVFALAWMRASGSAHLEVYFDKTVIPGQADASMLSIVPEFATLKERYPVTTSNPLSWPLYYRKDNTVHACTARYVSDELHSLQLAADPTTLQQLAILAQECITPAHLVEEYARAHPLPDPQPEPEPVRTQAPHVGGYLEKDLARQVIADFNASHSWESLLGTSNRRGKYLASWRGDCDPNVAVDARTDLAKDFSINAWLPFAMDKYQVYCLVEGGPSWEAFKRQDLARRCAELREAQEPDEEEEQHAAPYPPPDRLTMCCSAGWRWNGGSYECVHCRGQRERRAS